jgi:chitosanase
VNVRLWAAVLLAATLTGSVIVLAIRSEGRSRVPSYPVAVPSGASPPADSGTPTPSASATPASGLTSSQRRKVDGMISAFENSTTAIQYGYAENLHDGRGVTSGRAGFTTADGDALDVVRRYTARRPDDPLTPFVPALTRLAGRHSGDTGALPEEDYVAAWRRAAADPAFRRVQDEAVDRLYYAPAMALARTAGLRTALARAEVYDAVVQHGDGDDLDGAPALVERATRRAGGSPARGVEERRWLAAFFAVRLDDLRHPADDATRKAWSESVDRVDCLRRIARAGNTDLRGPIAFSVYGDDFLVE